MNLNKILDDAIKAPTGIVEESGDGKMERAGRFAAILTGKERFEGEIDSPEQLHAIIKGIKQFENELSGKKTDEDSKTGAMKKRLAKMLDKADDIEKILNKKEKGTKLSKDEIGAVMKFSQEVSDILISETYMKEFTEYEKGGSGGKVNKILFNHSFPVEYTADNGSKHYGLIRMPTGIVTWQGRDTMRIVKSDPEFKIQSRFQVLRKDYRLNKSKELRELIDAGRIKYKDDDKTKKKVRDMLEKAGASINERGDIKGLNRALKNVEFWKSIKSFF